MRTQFVDPDGLLREPTRDLAERRLLFALARFDPRIRQVRCTFEDATGPRGGVDIACRIVVSLRGANDVIVHEQEANLESCVSRAAERAGRAVARSIDRASYKTRTGAGSPAPSNS